MTGPDLQPAFLKYTQDRWTEHPGGGGWGPFHREAGALLRPACVRRGEGVQSGRPTAGPTTGRITSVRTNSGRLVRTSPTSRPTSWTCGQGSQEEGLGGRHWVLGVSDCPECRQATVWTNHAAAQVNTGCFLSITRLWGPGTNQCCSWAEPIFRSTNHVAQLVESTSDSGPVSFNQWPSEANWRSLERRVLFHAFQIEVIGEGHITETESQLYNCYSL